MWLCIFHSILLWVIKKVEALNSFWLHRIQNFHNRNKTVVSYWFTFLKCQSDHSKTFLVQGRVPPTANDTMRVCAASSRINTTTNKKTKHFRASEQTAQKVLSNQRNASLQSILQKLMSHCPASWQTCKHALSNSVTL